jgi:voltage-gated potassium channel
MPDPKTPTQRALEGERHELLRRVSRAAAMPMLVLGFIWLLLVVLELTAGLSPFLSAVATVIWGLFVLQFLLEFTLAPRKLDYLRTNWLTAVSLVAPAFRVLSAFRLLRLLRAGGKGLRLLRVVSATNRGMRSLGRVMARRGTGYVALLTVVVTLGGAAGMYAFERGVPGSTIDSFGAALWWTAMIITTMGSDYFPRTSEGRMLCLLLATYGFAVFGYVTATIASLFVARDADDDRGELAGARQLEQLRADIAALRNDVKALASRDAG